MRRIYEIIHSSLSRKKHPYYYEIIDDWDVEDDEVDDGLMFM